MGEIEWLGEFVTAEEIKVVERIEGLVRELGMYLRKAIQKAEGWLGSRGSRIDPVVKRWRRWRRRLGRQ
jgi:hypothetical protein